MKYAAPHVGQVADDLGFTRERVWQIQNKAEEKLATHLRALGFEPLPPRNDKHKQQKPNKESEPVEAIR